MHNNTAKYRQALSLFTTGITVITALDSNADKIGVTVNSFSSVSLEPPLVLWSLAKDTKEYDEFIQAKHYCINILSQEQKRLSEQFANPYLDKFSNINTEPGLHNIPKLAGCISYFECSHWRHYDGGDHTILIGQVENHRYDNALKPLVFFNSQYLSIS